MLYKDPKDGSLHEPPRFGWIGALFFGPVAFAFWGAWRMVARYLGAFAAVVMLATAFSAVGRSESGAVLTLCLFVIFHLYTAFTARMHVARSYERRGYLNLERYSGECDD